MTDPSISLAFSLAELDAPDVPPRSTVVEVVPPDGIDPALDVIAGRVISGDMERGERDQAIIPVHDLQVPEVGGAAEAFPGKMAAPHLRGRVGSLGAGVHHLAPELHHAGVRRQVAEEHRRPVTHQLPVPELQPPVAVVRVFPDEQADVELASFVAWGWGDGRAHGDPAVGLHEAGTEQVVAPRRLVRVRLHELFQNITTNLD